MQKIMEDKLAPDMVSFGSAINACAKGNQVDQALGLLQEMEKRGMKANQVGPEHAPYVA